jgi:hypothetical protein
MDDQLIEDETYLFFFCPRSILDLLLLHSNFIRSTRAKLPAPLAPSRVVLQAVVNALGAFVRAYLRGIARGAALAALLSEAAVRKTRRPQTAAVAPERAKPTVAMPAALARAPLFAAGGAQMIDATAVALLDYLDSALVTLEWVRIASEATRGAQSVAARAISRRFARRRHALGVPTLCINAAIPALGHNASGRSRLGAAGDAQRVSNAPGGTAARTTLKLEAILRERRLGATVTKCRVAVRRAPLEIAMRSTRAGVAVDSASIAAAAALTIVRGT